MSNCNEECTSQQKKILCLKEWHSCSIICHFHCFLNLSRLWDFSLGFFFALALCVFEWDSRFLNRSKLKTTSEGAAESERKKEWVRKVESFFLLRQRQRAKLDRSKLPDSATLAYHYKKTLALPLCPGFPIERHLKRAGKLTLSPDGSPATVLCQITLNKSHVFIVILALLQ